MKIISKFIIIILFQFLAACSSSPLYGGSSSSTIFMGTTWYDNYWDYWQYHDYYCCHDDHDFSDSIERWWDNLSSEEQDNVKENIDDWVNNDGEPDLDGLEDALRRKWDTMPVDEQQKIIEQGKKLRDGASVMPVSQLEETDTKAVTPASGEVPTLTPAQKQEAKAKVQSMTPAQKEQLKQQISERQIPANINRSQVRSRIQSMRR